MKVNLAFFLIGLLGISGHAEDTKYESFSIELLKRAEAGDVRAQNNLGHCYLCGKHGVSIDDKEAVRWYTKAADQGDANSQSNLGYFYREGKGVAKDANEAVNLYRLRIDI